MPAVNNPLVTVPMRRQVLAAAGASLTGLHQPGAGVRFWLNGQPRGAIADARFGPSFFGIWLAEATSEPNMRRELLAGTS
jgi:hypothetical protein